MKYFRGMVAISGVCLSLLAGRGAEAALVTVNADYDLVASALNPNYDNVNGLDWYTSLPIDLGTVNLVGGDQLRVNVTFRNATTLAGLVTAINAAFQAVDKNITASVEGVKLVVIDATGRNASSAALAGDPAFKNGLETVVQGTGTSTTDEFDRLVFKAYQDASANLGVDDTKNGLGGNAYAKDLVVDFTGGTTTLAERQEWQIQFQNLNQGDLVTVNVNGKTFSATVGTAYDGTQILGETTDAFVARFLQQFNARQLDISSRSGDLTASQRDVITNPANVNNESVLVLEEDESTTPDAREHVYM